MINLAEPNHVTSNNTLNLHGHRINRSQDIIVSYIIKIRTTSQDIYLFLQKHGMFHIFIKN